MRIKRRKRLLKKEIIVSRPKGLDTSILNKYYKDKRFIDHGKVRRHAVLSVVETQSIKVDNGYLLCPSSVYGITTDVKPFNHTSVLKTQRRINDDRISRTLDKSHLIEISFPKSFGSSKAFYRWARKQVLPEGTKIIAYSHIVKDMRLEYVVKYPKYNATRTLVIRHCLDCVNSKRLRNYAQSYDEIKCWVNKKTIFRKDLGIL